MVFGNEATGAWRGTIAYVAIYDRRLSKATVAAHHQTGFPTRQILEDESPLLGFDFTPGAEAVQSNIAGTVPPVPRRVRVSLKD